MLFLKKFFGTGKPAARQEVSDRAESDVARFMSPEKIASILRAANGGDIEDQCRLCREILERNPDILSAVGTRRNAILGCQWSIEPGDETPRAQKAAEALRDELESIPALGEVDTFEDLLDDMTGALLPGFAVSEILWVDGGRISGFNSIGQKHFTFVDGFTPLLRTGDRPGGEALVPERIMYHRLRLHGKDPARGGLIRPLAWMHCFSNLDFKYLEIFLERYGMPFLALKADHETYERDRNVLKRLVRNFGSSGGGIFERSMELELLETKTTGDVYFKLLEYLSDAIYKIVLGQTASSGDSAGLSKGDAQSQVRQDILEADCRWIERTVNSQLFARWMTYNFGSPEAAPKLAIDCTEPEDKLATAQTIQALAQAGLQADPEEMSERFSMKLTRMEGATPKIEKPVRMGAEEPEKKKSDEAVIDAVDAWFGPVEKALSDLIDTADPAAFSAKLAQLAENPPFGSSETFEAELENTIYTGIAAGAVAEHDRLKARAKGK